MSRYTSDHKFSKLSAEQFAQIGHWDFINPISSQPWGSRSRVIARIRVFEKYLTDTDIHQAFWVMQQAVQKSPNDYNAEDAGIVYLNSLLHERSGGKYIDEMRDLAKTLPTAMQYAEAADEMPSSEEIAKYRRAQMMIVADASSIEPAKGPRP